MHLINARNQVRDANAFREAPAGDHHGDGALPPVDIVIGRDAHEVPYSHSRKEFSGFTQQRSYHKPSRIENVAFMRITTPTVINRFVLPRRSTSFRE